MIATMLIASRESGWRAFPDEGVKIVGSLENAAPKQDAPLLLVFFSTECHVCWEELFEMGYFIEKQRIPVQLVGVSPDRVEELREFLEKYSFRYPVVADRKRELHRKFKVTLAPYKVIVRNNKVFYRDDYLADFHQRREKAQQCLLGLKSK